MAATPDKNPPPDLYKILNLHTVLSAGCIARVMGGKAEILEARKAPKSGIDLKHRVHIVLGTFDQE